MIFFLFSSAILLLSSFLCLIVTNESQKRFLGCGGVVLGSLVGLVPSLLVLKNNFVLEWTLGSLLPGLTLSLGIDGLSAFFLLVVFLLSALTGVYGFSYFKGQPRLVSTLPFFPLLVLSMALVISARDGFFFLVCWEVMSLASFFLVTSEHEMKEVRYAGWIYLIATHLATAFLMLFFVLLYGKSGSFLFADFLRIPSLSPVLATVLFWFALVGFGTKAGIFPFHIWLPHAHPAAPSPVSALMSGVMIKTGIYGLLRALTFLGPIPAGWGEWLVVLGVLSAVLGVLYALMQHDLKRLLAYCSVENIGIILTGIGLGLMGMAYQNPLIELLGFAGALFHVLNHALFKGLLFLGAGNILHATHTRSIDTPHPPKNGGCFATRQSRVLIDSLGGLLKKMPMTGFSFLVAASAICGLPPFNGFVSEWLIYMGLFSGTQSLAHVPLFLSVSGIVGIAFAGGLAVACFTKVFGVIFLGEPRCELKAPVCEASLFQLVPMTLLAALCLALGVYPQIIWSSLISAIRCFDPGLLSAEMPSVLFSLTRISRVFLMTLGIFIVLLLVSRRVFRKRDIQTAPTWDCGYAWPTPRMQYTASSFAEPIAVFFKPLLKPDIHFKKTTDYFPAREVYSEHVDDLAEGRFFTPIFKKAVGFLFYIRRFQTSRVQDYLVLIFITLMALLLWEVWIGF